MLTGVIGPLTAAPRAPGDVSGVGVVSLRWSGGTTVDHRTTHYSLWFIFFGVIAALSSLVNNAGVSSTSIWFLVTGLLGIIVMRVNEGKLARPYDLIVGIIFAVVGVIGILAAFKVHLITGSMANGAISSDSILGLSTAFFNSLIYAVLGFTSLNHGLKTK
jgi:hypothetical protein